MNFQADFERFNETYPVKCKQINGLTFNYRLGGNGEKTIVLLVGGLGISDAFYKHFTAFAKSFTVLTFDYPVESCRNSVLADGIAELIKTLGLNKVFLVGQSYGGLIAQVIAKKHPEIVAGMVLSNTGCLDADMGEDAEKFMFKMLRGLKTSVRLLKLLPMSLSKRISLNRMEKNFNQCTPDLKRFLTDLFRYVYNKLTRRHELNMCMLMMDLQNEMINTKSDFYYLDKKVLLLLSEDDHTFGDPVKQALIQLMPNPTVNSKICGGHIALLLQTELYIDTVTQFINGIE